MRIHFFGVQGSGSTFPNRAERQAMHEKHDCELLLSVFRDLTRWCVDKERVDLNLKEFLGGELNPKTLIQYRQSLMLPETRVYGGWTTCVHVETADGHDLVFDCGSGFRNCALDLQRKWGDRAQRHLHLFGSHSHSDHTEGLDQAAVCFDPRNRIHIYGNAQFLGALDRFLGIFTRNVADDARGVQTPVFYQVMPAAFRATEIRSPDAPVLNDSSPYGSTHILSEPIRIGDVSVTCIEVHHSAPCLAYKIEERGRSFVFCTDHELRHNPGADDALLAASMKAESDLIQLSTNADLLYRDGQYLRSEYDGAIGIGQTPPVARLGWGHSCIEDVEAMAVQCRVRRTLIGHHDPNREWAERNWIDESLARTSREGNLTVELARAETVIDLN